MRVPKSLTLSLAVILVLASLPLTVAARQAAQAAAIEPELLRRLQADGTADFFVKMAAEADLTVAMRMDWHSRGEYVWNAVNEVARVAQAPVLEYARQNGLDARSLLASDSVYIRGGDLATARALAALPGVAYLQMERIYSLLEETQSPAQPLTTSPQGSLTWNIADSRAPEAWAIGARGQGIKVANIDTGVQWNHPALIDQFACPGEPANPACWADPSNICGTGGACDNIGHGTHVMGTMVAKDDPGLPYIAGMAPGASWIACKGCESNSCSGYALTACADWILAPGGEPDNRPQVVTAAWAVAGCDPWYRPEVQAWRAAGIFPSFKIGSAGPACGSVGSPGDYQESFAAAAHSESRTVASFSSRGPGCYGDDPYTKPNLSAPGVNICSTYPTDDWICEYSGTAMAAAHPSGAAALILSACPDYIGQVDAMLELLQDNADPPPAGSCGAPPDGEGNYTYGYGYLNVLAAVLACLPPEQTGTLEGLVYDGISGMPFPGIMILIEPVQPPGNPIQVITDPNGHYSAELLVGTYDVTASAPPGYEYEPQTARVEILANQTTVQDFALLPIDRLHINRMKMNWAPAARPGRYKVTATARIQDAAHLAAAGATVLGDYTYPDGSVHSLSAVTNLRGVAKFRAKGSLTGVYSFCITGIDKAGYVYYPPENEDGPCKSMNVTP